jgi:hypothetical protein
MKIGLCFDNVVADVSKAKLEAAADFRQTRALAKAEPRLVERAVRCNPKYAIERLQPVDEASVYIKLLRTSGQEVMVVTDRVDQALRFARQWARGYWPKLEFRPLAPRESLRTAISGFDLYVDADPQRLASLLGAGPELLHLSHGEPTPPGVTRTESWPKLFRAMLHSHSTR